MKNWQFDIIMGMLTSLAGIQISNSIIKFILILCALYWLIMTCINGIKGK